MGAGTLVQNIRRIVTRFHMGTESGTGRGRLARTTYAEPSPWVLSTASPKTAAHQKQQPFPEQRSSSTAMALTPGNDFIRERSRDKNGVPKFLEMIYNSTKKEN